MILTLQYRVYTRNCGVYEWKEHTSANIIYPTEVSDKLYFFSQSIHFQVVHLVEVWSLVSILWRDSHFEYFTFFTPSDLSNWTPCRHHHPPHQYVAYIQNEHRERPCVYNETHCSEIHSIFMSVGCRQPKLKKKGEHFCATYHFALPKTPT